MLLPCPGGRRGRGGGSRLLRGSGGRGRRRRGVGPLGGLGRVNGRRC